MKPADFSTSEAGKVILVPEGYRAFIPAPLPPNFSYDAALALSLSRADAALSELSGLGRLLPNPHLLISPYVRREALLSSRIEGTRASLSDVLLDEMGEDAAHSGATDVHEVRNTVNALDFGVKRLGSLPLSLRLTRELHARLMKGVRGDRPTPGEFRRSQNWIGPRWQHTRHRRLRSPAAAQGIRQVESSGTRQGCKPVRRKTTTASPHPKRSRPGMWRNVDRYI